MIFRYVILAWCVIFSTGVSAFPCFFTLVKDTCWTDYAVTVVVTDAEADKALLTVTVPKGQTYARQAFTCQAAQKLLYTATFSPTIWEGQEGKVYRALRFWALPGAPNAKAKAWEIPVCFPSAFAEVPFPPSATGNCQCSFKDVPPIPLEK